MKQVLLRIALVQDVQFCFVRMTPGLLVSSTMTSVLQSYLKGEGVALEQEGTKKKANT